MTEPTRPPRDSSDQSLPTPGQVDVAPKVITDIGNYMLATGLPSSLGDAIVADIRDRIEIGIKRYGHRLQAHNGRDALLDAYQEALDLTNYLKQYQLESSVAGARSERAHSMTLFYKALDIVTSIKELMNDRGIQHTTADSQA